MPKLATRRGGSTPAVSAPERSPSAFAPYAWFALIFNLGVTLSGAYVRATGSGAGCGNHWPLCNGEITPTFSTIHTVIEFTHRAMTGLDTPVIAILLIWAFRAFPKHHPVRLAAGLSTAFLVSEALIGAALVKFEHVARHADAYSLSMHLVNTLTLLACLTLTAWWGAGNRFVRPSRKAAWLAAASLAAVMLLAITGVVAALGDTLNPAPSLAVGLAQDFDPAASLLTRLRIWHPIIAAAVGGWLTVYAFTRLRVAQHAGMRLIIAVWLQLLAGLMNLLFLAPVALQMVHLLLADLVWISLILLCATAA